MYLNLVSEGCAKYKNKFYFVSKDMNIIYSIDEITKDVKYEGCFEDEPIDAVRLCARILTHNDALIFVPMNAPNVSIFNLNDKSWKYVKVRDIEKYNYDRFFSAEIYEDKLFLIGSTYPSIMVVNLSDLSAEYISEMYIPLYELLPRFKDCFVRAGVAKVNNTLYISSCLNNQVLIFNMDDYQWEKVEVGEKGNRYVGIAYDGSDFWLAPRRQGNIVRWNERTGVTQEYSLDYMDRDQYYFGSVVFDGNNIIFPGMQSKHTVIIDPTVKNPFDERKEIPENFSFYFAMDERNYGMTDTGKFMIYDSNCPTEPLLERKAVLSCGQLIDAHRGKVMLENTVFGLKHFIDGI